MKLKSIAFLLGAYLFNFAYAQNEPSGAPQEKSALPVLGVVSKTNAQKIVVAPTQNIVQTNIVVGPASAESVPAKDGEQGKTNPFAIASTPATKKAKPAPLKVQEVSAKEPAPIKLKPISAPAARDEIILPPPPPKAIEGENLPGIGFMPGENPDLKNKVIKAGSQRNEISYISSSFINRIATPFRSPRVIDQSGADIRVDGSDVYVKPSTALPIAIYIVDDVSRQTISMTLVPKNLPAQTLVAQIQTQSISAEKSDPLPEEYIAKLTNVNLQIAQDKLPSGFTEASLPASISRINNLTITPLKRYSGSTYDVYKYEVASGYQNTIELKEDAFFNDQNIRTISFFPATTLANGQKTYMFIVSDKPKSEKNKGLSF